VELRSKKLQHLDLTLSKTRKLCSNKSRAVRHVNSNPQDKIQNILMMARHAQAGVKWKMWDDLIPNGCANAAHVCFRHNPAGVHGETD